MVEVVVMVVVVVVLVVSVVLPNDPLVHGGGGIEFGESVAKSPPGVCTISGERSFTPIIKKDNRKNEIKWHYITCSGSGNK